MASNSDDEIQIVDVSAILLVEDEETLSERVLTFDPNYMIPPVNSATLAVTLTFARPGLAVRLKTEPASLTGPEWRRTDDFVARWPSAASARLRQRIAEGNVRLQSSVDRTSGTTDANGKITVRVRSWHSCGEDQEPMSDNLVVEWGTTGRYVRQIFSGVKDLVRMSDELGWNMRLASGVHGRFALQTVINRLTRVGLAWDDVEEAPASTQFSLFITDASIRWGGLYPPHLSHRFGGSVDLRVPSTDGQASSPSSSNYDRAGVIWLCQLLTQQNASEIRFADNVPGVTAVDPSHATHLHVSFLSNPREPWIVKPLPR